MAEAALDQAREAEILRELARRVRSLPTAADGTISIDASLKFAEELEREGNPAARHFWKQLEDHFNTATENHPDPKLRGSGTRLVDAAKAHIWTGIAAEVARAAANAHEANLKAPWSFTKLVAWSLIPFGMMFLLEELPPVGILGVVLELFVVARFFDSRKKP